MANKHVKRKPDREIVLNVMSNSPNEGQVNLLQLIYTGAFENTLALMEAQNSETGDNELLLVGMEYKDDNFSAFPLARLLQPEETAKYLAPDGKGNYDRTTNS